MLQTLRGKSHQVVTRRSVLHLVCELSESQQGAQGRGQVCVVRVTGVCVCRQSLKQSRIFLRSPHWTQQQLLQASQTNTTAS